MWGGGRHRERRERSPAPEHGTASPPVHGQFIAPLLWRGGLPQEETGLRMTPNWGNAHSLSGAKEYGEGGGGADRGLIWRGCTVRSGCYVPGPAMCERGTHSFSCAWFAMLNVWGLGKKMARYLGFSILFQKKSFVTSGRHTTEP